MTPMLALPRGASRVNPFERSWTPIYNFTVVTFPDWLGGLVAPAFELLCQAWSLLHQPPVSLAVQLPTALTLGLVYHLVMVRWCILLL